MRDLRPRLAFDRIANTVTARKGAAFALYTSGGTIPDRGYFNLRHADSGAAIGELDEEFVWEASVGDTFTLGTQNWRVHRITHNDVLVKSAPSKSTAPPFWRAESFNRGYHFSSRVGRFLEHADDLLGRRRDDDFKAELAALGFDEIAATELTDFLARQREVTGCDLPHANHLVVEHILSAPGGYQGPDREQQVVLHTFWGGRVNRSHRAGHGSGLAAAVRRRRRRPRRQQRHRFPDLRRHRPVDPALAGDAGELRAAAAGVARVVRILRAPASGSARGGPCC